MRILLVSLFTGFLCACSGTGGIIGNLIPAPKFLKGEVKEGTYYYSENDKFRVMLPHPPSLSRSDNYEWTYTKVREINDEGMVIGAVFGPAAFDMNLYHAVIVTVNRHIDSYEEYVSSVFDTKVKLRKSNFKQVAEKTFESGDKNAFYSVYESAGTYLVLSIVVDEGYLQIVDVDVDKNSAVGLPSKQQLVERSWEVFNRMFDSFQVLDIRNSDKRLQIDAAPLRD